MNDLLNEIDHVVKSVKHINQIDLQSFHQNLI